MELAYPPYFRHFLIVLLFLGLSTRLFHLGHKIEDPHSWRQSDTAQYIWNFYTEGIDILHPGVCWMGSHKTVILEFPLYQAFAALLYFVFGPHHEVARIVTLILFLVSLGYFYLILKRLFNSSFALLASTILCWLPLGIYYSRAIHIDFSAVAFGMIGLYYFLAWLDTEKRVHLYISTVGFILGFLIKSPYIFLFAFPLIYHISLRQQWKRVVQVTYLLGLPVIVFFIWRKHVSLVNAAAPDWFFIPGYVKFTEMSEWYFGSWEQRKDQYIWKVLWQGFLHHTVTPMGIIPFILGFLVWKPISSCDYPLFLHIWWWGTALYGVLFFNLAYFHDYYHIPFLFPSASVMALSIYFFLARTTFLLPAIKYSLCIIFLVFFTFRAYLYTEKTYFKLDEQIIQAGQLVNEQTEKEHLIITSAPYMDCRNPNWLYRARRLGWSIMPQHLSHSLIEKLQQEGATHLASLSKPLADSLLTHVINPQKLPLSLAQPDTVYLYTLPLLNAE